jgi:serine phosphatase RsbU (regulator of sigma subunit)
VVLYADGVTEAWTADGELFGLERLSDLLERSSQRAAARPTRDAGYARRVSRSVEISEDREGNLGELVDLLRREPVED